MRNIIKIKNKALLLLLAILGFNSCKKETVDEYGCPLADFIINGNVISNITSNPIKGIKVKAHDDSTFTDENGKFSFTFSSFPADHEYSVYFYDVDDSLNGNFEDKDTIVEFIDPQFTGGDGWYEGKTVKEIEIKLNPATE